MIRFFKNLFKGKEPSTVAEPTKVDAVNAAPYKVEPPVLIPQLSVAEEVKAVAKKRTFKKREEGGTAKVAKIKAPAKPQSKAASKPKTPK